MVERRASAYVVAHAGGLGGRTAAAALLCDRYGARDVRRQRRVAPAAADSVRAAAGSMTMKTTLYQARSGPKLRELLSKDDATVYDLDSNAVDLVANAIEGAPSGAVLVWMRHYGCVLCKQLLASVQKEIEREAASLGYALVAVGPGKPEQAEQFKAKVEWKHKVLSDPLRTTYRALNFKKGMFNTFNLGGLKSMVSSFAQGYTQDWTVIPTDPFALGGLLVVDADGTVILNHIDDFAGDHPDMKLVKNAMREFASPNLVK
ncbi:Thioredoxin-like protein AAED1, chloroplastic [Porphyridium purpureum]|uniref:Thioredoxin-like protein AAED1, chloroplastic n=1 Tax=Porphyridium purpureum TaxID=35688 RepID=A0A5J4Z102_PORPP|nr:Thioredoxin-like protein AAED1, chloroplastic [Porphyridium purpureum]|eukprot:POR4122..scf208_2